MAFTQVIRQHCVTRLNGLKSPSPVLTFRRYTSGISKSKTGNRVQYYTKIVFNKTITKDFFNLSATSRSALASIWLDMDAKKMKIQKATPQDPPNTQFNVCVANMWKSAPNSTMCISPLMKQYPALESLINQQRVVELKDSYFELDI